VLPGIAALALLVRLHRIDLPGLTSDEAFSWRMTGYPLPEMLARLAQDVHPPLHFVLLQGWLALFGDSALALRGLSALFGVAAVLALHRACLAACGGALTPGARAAAAWAAGLAAVHASQVDPGRNARMYSLGLLLAALCALLLWRAVAEGRTVLWLGYGAAAAAFCATHYYALFTLASQLAWLLGVAVLRTRRSGRTAALPLLRGLLWSGLAGLLLFGPWLPVLWGQVRRVQSDYWIAPLEPGRLAAALTSWAWGLDGPVGPLLGVLGLLLAVGAWWGGPAARFFLVQACGPWLLAIGLSVAAGRPIFLERYLAFAGLALAGFWGALWPRLGGRARALVLGPVLACALVGQVHDLRALPAGPSATAQGAAFLAERGQPGDLVLVDSPRALNRLRFYLRQAGVSGLEVRCAPAPGGGAEGHYTHLASVAPDDMLPEGALSGSAVARVWLARDGLAPLQAPEGFVEVGRRSFEVADSRFTLVRCRRLAPGPAGPPEGPP
jgi:hypothetical protein